MGPFHVVRLAGDALDRCRRRTQQAVHGHRGRKDDPLYRARRTPHTGADLLTDKQRQRLQALFADDAHVHVEATWGIYQGMIAAYREPDRAKARDLMVEAERVHQHRRPHSTHRGHHPRPDPDQASHRRAGLLFDHPNTSNGPTEAINGRLEHLRGCALGFRNLTNYITRSLLETGGFKPYLHSQLG